MKLLPNQRGSKKTGDGAERDRDRRAAGTAERKVEKLRVRDRAKRAESPDDALRIFTEDIVEVESLPRQLVLDHLTSVAADLTMPYLVSAWDVYELNAYQSETQTMVWV